MGDGSRFLFSLAGLIVTLAACVLPEATTLRSSETVQTQRDAADKTSARNDEAVAPRPDGGDGAVSSMSVTSMDAGSSGAGDSGTRMPHAGTGGANVVTAGMIAMSAAGVGGIASRPCTCSVGDSCCDGCNPLPESAMCSAPADVDCKDGDAIKPGYCFINNKCYSDGNNMPGYTCLYCDAGRSQVMFSTRPEGTACDDRQFCNGTDKCDALGRCSVSSGSPCNKEKCETCVESSQECIASWDTYYDPTTRYLWTETNDVSWEGAAARCESITTCGFDDWQLATVDATRGLIQGCPAAQDGGACRLSERCLSRSCASDCDGCMDGGGSFETRYVPVTSQRYRGSSYWTAAAVQDEPNMAWAFSASTASFFASGATNEFTGLCVRVRPP